MPLALAALFVLLAGSNSSGLEAGPAQEPAPAASPSPTPLFRLLPYWYESDRDRTPGPLLRFEDQAEVRALEMNAAIARFFDSKAENGNMLRGATPGGAPTIGQMTPYRPHMSPSLSLLGLALIGAREIHKQVRSRQVNKGEALLRELLLNPPPSPTPTPSDSPAPSATPTPTPTPTRRPSPENPAG